MNADPRFPKSMTLAAARIELRPLAAAGHECPLCRQWVQIRKRALANAHARAIAALYAEHHTNFAHWPTTISQRVPDLAGQGGFLLLSQHWGLIESEETALGDTGRDGYWRVTTLGIAWLLGQEQVPKYAEIYNKRCWGHSGPLVSREDILGEHFDFDALQRDQATVPDGLLHAPEAA